jgi:hypothetical protein
MAYEERMHLFLERKGQSNIHIRHVKKKKVIKNA